MNCQYALQRLVIIMPKTVRNVPMESMVRRKPMSKMEPMALVPAMKMHSCREPIQDILDGDDECRRLVS